MFEHAEIRFKARGEQNILLGKRSEDGGESSSHHNSLWMAHWTSSSHTQNKQGSISLSSKNTNTRVAEQLVIGMNRRTTTTTTTNPDLLGTRTNENFDFYFNSLTQKSTGRTSEVLEGSDHFPMYGIKKKIESILNPKGKARFIGDNKVSSLNLTFHSSEEFHFESVERNCNGDHQLTALHQSCSCTEEGNNNNNNNNNLSTSSQIKCPSNSNRMQSMDSADDDSLRGSSKRKAVSLFEMVSSPTESRDVAQSCKRQSKSCEGYKWRGMIDGFGKSKEPFEMSDPKDRESFEELASSRAQKVRTVSPEKSLFSSGQNIGSLNINPDTNSSRTVTMDASDSLLKSGSKRKANSSSMEKQQEPSDQEGHGNRWLKRLKHDVSGNALVTNPNQLKNSDPSWVSDQQMKSWIKRWCVKKLTSEEESERFGIGQEESQERQFPSIHAMAMMGKAMNKIRPGEFEKRGPSVVWNNNEF